MPRTTPHSTAGDFTQLRPHELASWLNTLPLADVGETYQRLTVALSRLNDSDLIGGNRFEGLELFRGPVQYVCEGLKQHFVGASLPLPPKARAIADKVYDLHLTIAEGYLDIADELLALATLRQDFTMLTTSLHRALHYLGQGLLAHYQVYESDNSACWRRIHHCYEAAERKGIQASVVKDQRRHNKQATSIEDQYKQILLLALANPFRHPQSDIAWIYMLLERWTPLCRFHPADALDEPQFACLLDLASGEGPAHIAYSGVPHPASCRILDTTALIHTLQKSSPRPSSHEPESRLTPTTVHRQDLVKSLIIAWGMAAKRRYSRLQPTSDDVEISLGLSAIHQLITPLDSFPREGTEDDGAEGRMTSFDNHTPYGAAHRGEDNGPYLCKVINESAEGLRLMWGNTDKAKVRIGELVAIQQPAEPGELPGIGVIRWLKTADRDGVEFGVQLLSPDAIPITLRHYSGKERASEHDYLKGLYIPEFNTTRRPASLILPAFLYHVDDIVSLLMDGQEHYLRLVKATETTQGYSRFRFTHLAIPQEQQH